MAEEQPEVVLAERQDAVAVALGQDQIAHVIAFTPVSARAMISFWICEVPS